MTFDNFQSLAAVYGLPVALGVKMLWDAFTGRAQRRNADDIPAMVKDIHTAIMEPKSGLRDRVTVLEVQLLERTGK